MQNEKHCLATRDEVGCSLYELLGVEPEASYKVIKAAYHRLARQYHPDKGNTEHNLFNEVNQAWVILSCESSRRDYDANMQSTIKIFDAALRSAEGVTLSDFVFSPENGEYYRHCRCGEGFKMTKECLVYKVLLLPCSGCSLNVKVISDDSLSDADCEYNGGDA
ncbi:hypothetical protein EON65_37730 [archaeon]|nr:MAG: hypothetical protein EON65_37730 [archaeon]